VGLVIAGAYLLALPSWRVALAPLQMVADQRSVWLAIAASVLWGLTPVFEKTAILHTFPENPTAAAFGALLALVIILFPIMQLKSHHRLCKPARGVLRLSVSSVGSLHSLGMLLGAQVLSDMSQRCSR
jgi:drug/metabolite transporter (DMT)-like permease